MKIILILATMISGFSFGQTNIIAAKSHSSAKTIEKNDLDNFGGPAIEVYRQIESVEYLGTDCIVEKNHVLSLEKKFEYDTICDHPFLKEGNIHIDRLKAMYPENTEFINFEELNNDEGHVRRKVRNESRSQKSGTFWLILVFGGLFLIYLFAPKLRLKAS